MRCEFTMVGRLPEAAIAVFPELTVSGASGKGTTLHGPVIDRAHRDGLLARFGVWKFAGDTGADQRVRILKDHAEQELCWSRPPR